VRFLFARRFYKDEDFLLYLDRVDSYLQALDQPFPARLQHIARLDQDVQKRRSRNIFTLMTSRWAKTVRNDAEIQARLFVASVALAVERYRLSHDGRLPNALSDLVPGYFRAIPLDPYATNPLQCRLLKNGFVVYSIGQDGQDNGGAEKPVQASDAMSYDLPFAIER
jgi:hypothetical protein